MELQLYPKVKRADNLEDYQKEKIKKAKAVVITEKIDGSNICILKYNDKLYPFSRKKLITDLGNFKGLEDWLEINRDTLLKEMEDMDVLCCEYLGQGKLPYNKKVSHDEYICRMNVFNYGVLIVIENNGKEICELFNNIEMYKKGKDITRNLKDTSFVRDFAYINDDNELPGMKEKMTNGDEFCNTIIEGEKSYIDNETKIEGLVFKYLSKDFEPITEVKYVSKEFLENKNNKHYKDFDIIYNYLTPARFDKFFRNIEIEPTTENLNKIKKQIEVLVTDILTEEHKEIERMLREQFDIRAKQKVAKYVKEINKEGKE